MEQKKNIIYHLDGGSNDPNNPTSYGEGIGVSSFAPASKEGHDFKGWYRDESLTIPIDSISTTESEDVNLYAKFEPTDYDIIYHLDGGNNAFGNPTSYKYGIGVASFESASKDGHDFKGWYSDDLLTTSINSISATESGEVNLYAKFEPTDYDIVYHLDEGSNASGNPTSYKYGIGVASFESASKDGYDFKGWYSDAELTTSISSISVAQKGIVNLYAKFEAKDYNIIYHLDGGSNASGNPTSYKYGIGVSSFESASKDGYDFKGWYSDASLTTPISSISATQFGDMTLYAKYTIEEVVETKKEKETTKTADKNVEPKTGDRETVAGVPIAFLPIIMLTSGIVIIFMIRSFKKNKYHKN